MHMEPMTLSAMPANLLKEPVSMPNNTPCAQSSNYVHRSCSFKSFEGSTHRCSGTYCKAAGVCRLNGAVQAAHQHCGEHRYGWLHARRNHDARHVNAQDVKQLRTAMPLRLRGPSRSEMIINHCQSVPVIAASEPRTWFK